MNIAVFASHGGSDLQAIIDGCKNGKINAAVAVVISNNGDSMALQRSNDAGIPNYHMSANSYTVKGGCKHHPIQHSWNSSSVARWLRSYAKPTAWP